MKLNQAVFLMALLLAFPALASENGLYLCRSPVVASDFWNDVEGAQRLSLLISSDVLKRLSDKNECRFVSSSNLKPINFVAGEFLMTDGSISGWADPRLYILYVNGRLP